MKNSTEEKENTEGKGKGNDEGDKDNHKKRLRVPFWAHGSQCYEAALVDGKPSFVFYDNKKGRFDFRYGIELGYDTMLVPYEATESKYSLSSALLLEASVPQLGELYNEVHHIVQDYFAHLDARVKKFMALYIMHGYILTRSLGTVFVWLVGAKRAGKSTLQLICERLGYRVFSGVGASEPAIYRTLGHEVEYAPMIIVKEYGMASELMKTIAREGDVPGSTIPRSDKEGDAFVVNHYRIYGSRVVGSNVLHGDEADMDRYMVVKCMHLKPHRPRAELYRSRGITATLVELRNRILLWKVGVFGSLEFPFEDPRNEILEGRDWEHFGGIITLASMVSEELERDVRDLIRAYLAETAEEAKSSITSMLLEIVQNLATKERMEGDLYRIPFADIWEEVEKDSTPFIEAGVKVPTKVVTPDGAVLTSTRAGKVLKEQLLGKAERWYDTSGSMPKRVRGYTWTRRLLRILDNSNGTGGTTGTGLKNSDESNTLLNFAQTDGQNISPSSSEAVPPVLPVPKLPDTTQNTVPIASTVHAASLPPVDNELQLAFETSDPASLDNDKDSKNPGPSGEQSKPDSLGCATCGKPLGPKTGNTPFWTGDLPYCVTHYPEKTSPG